MALLSGSNRRHKRLIQIIIIALPLLFTSSLVDAGTTTYKYDVQGRVIEIDYPNGAIVKYIYDNTGNRTQVIKQAGS